MIVYGRNSIEEALLEKLQLSQVWIDEEKGDKYPGLKRLLREHNIPVRFITGRELDKISDTQKHQGIAAEMILPNNIITEDQPYERNYHNINRVLLLDGITDTGNLGAIIRSALLLGADLILLPKDNSARITPQTIKASAGAIYKISLAYVDNLKTEIDLMKAENFDVLALASESKISLYSFKTQKEKTALILGSEREGIRKGIKSLCTEKVSLASTKKLDSFNVSVAAALAMNALWGDILQI
ncbi:MAG: 23S rRNA (guanosine(2251)-2'-O)-methyltransferase RlmB [Brevinema sp.]